jgi:hypothetical protein
MGHHKTSSTDNMEINGSLNLSRKLSARVCNAARSKPIKMGNIDGFYAYPKQKIWFFRQI